jgi:hypothetical protein
VAIGWNTDPKYKTRGPPILPMSGRGRSFESLVKGYSGDIPAKAMLIEMSRLGMVTVKNDKVRLLRISTPVPRHTLTTLRAVSPWIQFLAERGDQQDRELDISNSRVRLRFGSLLEARAAIRELQSRAEAFVKSIAELGGGSRAESYETEVSIALATIQPTSRLKRRAIARFRK